MRWIYILRNRILRGYVINVRWAYSPLLATLNVVRITPDAKPSSPKYTKLTRLSESTDSNFLGRNEYSIKRTHDELCRTKKMAFITSNENFNCIPINIYLWRFLKPFHRLQLVLGAITICWVKSGCFEILDTRG